MTTRRYDLPTDLTRWVIPGHGASTVLDWNYDDGRDKLLGLYEKGKARQWNGSTRIDWSIDIDLDNPLGMSEEFVPIAGSDIWKKLDDRHRALVRHHVDAWRISQFLHGEQGALVCAAKIVQAVPDLDSKLYAATQVVDEARHVEVYARYLRDKMQLTYPINEKLKILLDQAITDSRWDFTYLAMQVVIEGMGLAAFGTVRDLATEPLARALNSYVMEDEVRHVAFGRLALKEYYPQLTQKERDERESFAVVACHLMRDRFHADDVWERLDLGPECATYVRNSQLARQYQKRLFSRLVPSLRDVGLWGPRVQRAFTELGVIEFAATDMDELSRGDEEIAAEMDRLKAQRTADIARVVNGDDDHQKDETNG